MDWKPTSVDPAKAQLVEANYSQIEEICRWFGVPPHKIAHLLRATFSNIEHQSIEVVQDSVLPWVRRLEDEADYKLFGQNRQGLYTKIELRGLLRGDFAEPGVRASRSLRAHRRHQRRRMARISRHAAAAGGSGGDKYTMQGQYTTLDKIGEEAQQDISQMAETADAGT
jgi:phage portal protein BeeE